MKREEPARLAHTLDQIAVGAAILDCKDLHILYANASILSFLNEPWRSQGVIGHALEDVIPQNILSAIVPRIKHVCETGESQVFNDVPYEGFLETRGHTYWQITIGPVPQFQTAVAQQSIRKKRPATGSKAILVTIEDVTTRVRSRLQLKAIHYITSVITDPFALPQVLDRILQTVQEMVGSKRCAILLLDRNQSSRETSLNNENRSYSTLPPGGIIRIASQQGLSNSAKTWNPPVSERLLFGRVARDRRTLIYADTSVVTELDLPEVDDDGRPVRPRSVLCVPIFEPTSQYQMEEEFYQTPDAHLHTSEVLGTIEVYHRRARSFPAEEVELLEQFSLHAGLAIRNARTFRSIDQLARVASRSARQRENILQAIPDGVIIYDARWRIIDFNDAIRELMGWSNDILGQHISKAAEYNRAIFPNNSAYTTEEIVNDMERLALEQHIAEIKMIGADGRSYTMRRSQAAIRDELGDVFAFVAVYHDVTEQAIARERIEEEVIHRTAELAQRNTALQRAKAALELESARMQLLLERLPSGVMLISSYDSRISVINRQAVQILQNIGISLEPLHDLNKATRNTHGQNIETLLRSITIYRPSGSIFPYEEQPLYKALNAGEASEAELFISQSYRKPLFLLVNAAPLRASDGTITNVVLLWHDITKMKVLEQTREDFFTAMAHELKTPLANIRAHLSALQARDLQLSPEEQVDFIRTADDQVERLVRMINQFLDASRVEAGALRLETEPILLPEMLEDLQDRLEALISNSKRRLEIRIPSLLPAISADYELIMSVLTNLLSNAFRYAPEGDSILLEVEPIYTDNINAPDQVEIKVSDNGPGLSQEQQAEIFTRFSTFAVIKRPDEEPSAGNRKRGSTRWSPSSGLGLYISRGIIEAHGSLLTLQSAPGEGATFAFTLPVATTAHHISNAVSQQQHR